MAFNLEGRIRIRDDGSSKAFDKVRRSTERAARAQKELEDTVRMVSRAQESAASSSNRLNRMLERARSTALGTGRAMKSSASSMGSAARQTASLTRQVGALGAAYLTARGAKGLFDKTIGAAADYEMREITVEAMFGSASKKNAAQYLDFVQSRADISMFTMDEFLDAGKSFIPTTKDNKQLEKMINLAERLGAMDKEQGLTGGAYALREYFSGDAVSLVERFELPRSVLNEWKKLPLEEQLKNLDKYFDKIGASNELLEAQSNTTLGQYRKSLGMINRALREWGTEGLRKINPLLQDFNKWLNGADFAKFKKWGTDMFSGLVNGAVDAVRKASAYINNNFINNPEFQRLPDIQAKIKYIFTTLMDDFKAWYNTDGRANVQSIATDLTNTLGAALKASAPLLDAAKTIGLSVGKSVVTGVLEAINADPIVSAAVFGGAGALVGGLPGALIGAGGGIVVSGIQGGQKRDELVDRYKNGGMNAEEKTRFEEIGKQVINDNVWGWPKKALGFSGGINNVPYNNMPALLHKGEEVLTREEAKRHRGEGGANGGGSRSVVISGNNFYVREEADIEKIAKRLAYEMAM